MKLNVPNINLTGDNNQEIIDILHRYRKELNFLLMNLDESNMPGVANRLEGLDGSFSQISQEVDAITLAVGNAQGDIASLQLTATGLQTQVSNQAGDISTLTQTVDGIQTTVNSHSTTLGQHSSSITQLSSSISSKVSYTDYNGNTIASLINQTATTISISADKINLTGITTLYSTTSGRYARYNAAGDFSCYEQNSAFFSVYNAGGGDFSLLRYGTAFLNASSLVSGVSAYGIWDFSSATVNGLTVRFG